MTEPLVGMLRGGHHNSLGRTAEVVAIVLAAPARLDELFEAIKDTDELVRLRVGDALEKVCREESVWFESRVDQLLDELGGIAQPSVQWHVAQMLDHLRGGLSAGHLVRATALLQRNLVPSNDWIVLNVTMDVLTRWAELDGSLLAWLVPELERLTGDARTSVAGRARKRLVQLCG